jgi:site-specific DNA-cytosine methylase
MWISIIVIIAMIAFFVYGQKIINRLPDTVYVFDITSMPSNMSFYTAYVFFSIITFTIIRQYTNAKALRIEASNRVAMSKMFEQVKLYKQFGNSVSIPVIERIAKNIKSALIK